MAPMQMICTVNRPPFPSSLVTCAMPCANSLFQQAHSNGSSSRRRRRGSSTRHCHHHKHQQATLFILSRLAVSQFTRHCFCHCFGYCYCLSQSTNCRGWKENLVIESNCFHKSELMIVVVRVLQTASIASVSNAHRAFRLQYGKDCHRRAVYAFQHCSPVSHYARNGAPGLHWRQARERESKPTQSKSSRAPCVSIHRLHSMD